MTTIKAMCLDEHVHDVEAHVFGKWAASRALGRNTCEVLPDRWVVTLVPSARCIASVVGTLSEQDAIAVAQALDREGPPIEDWRNIPPLAAWLIVEIARAAAPNRIADLDKEDAHG